MMIAAAIAAAMTLMADTETVGGYTWKYQINGDTAEIKSGISPKPTVALTIPSTLGGKPVTNIGGAFSDCCALKVVSLPRQFEGKLDKSVFARCAKDIHIEYR